MLTCSGLLGCDYNDCLLPAGSSQKDDSMFCFSLHCQTSQQDREQLLGQVQHTKVVCRVFSYLVAQ